jgi:hypothetical protein
MAAAKERMLRAAKELDFIEAAQQRDLMMQLEVLIDEVKHPSPTEEVIDAPHPSRKRQTAGRKK